MNGWKREESMSTLRKHGFTPTTWRSVEYKASVNYRNMKYELMLWYTKTDKDTGRPVNEFKIVEGLFPNLKKAYAYLVHYRYREVENGICDKAGNMIEDK